MCINTNKWFNSDKDLENRGWWERMKISWHQTWHDTWYDGTWRAVVWRLENIRWTPNVLLPVSKRLAHANMRWIYKYTCMYMLHPCIHPSTHPCIHLVSRTPTSRSAVLYCQYYSSNLTGREFYLISTRNSLDLEFLNAGATVNLGVLFLLFVVPLLLSLSPQHVVEKYHIIFWQTTSSTYHW